MPTDQLRILRVVLASPGDVAAERDIVPGIIDEVNRNIANLRGLDLKLYRGWPTFWKLSINPWVAHPCALRKGGQAMEPISPCM